MAPPGPRISVTCWLLSAALGLALVISGLFLGRSSAQHTRFDPMKVIDADQLKAWIDQGKTMLMIDSRVAPEFEASHIPGAINIPAPHMDHYRDRLPQDSAYPLVFYCNGWPECKKSHEGASKAIQWGYSQVYWFRDGIPAWQAHGYPVE